MEALVLVVSSFPKGLSKSMLTFVAVYISKQLAHVMSGDIDFTSVYGQGTTAKLTVPLSKSTTPPSSISPSTPESGNLSFDRTKTKILVAEDNPVNREVAVRFLQKAGYSVSSVENGQEVLDRVHEEHFHLLVMDCGMPQMDGYETARRLRASSLPQAYNLKILALTASAGANDRERCLEAGFNDYLTKPFKGKMLEKTVLDLLFAAEELPSRRSSLGDSNH
jgi:CheY-like chemotaxis protein